MLKKDDKVALLLCRLPQSTYGQGRSVDTEHQLAWTQPQEQAMNQGKRLASIGLVALASQMAGSAQACIVHVDDFTRMQSAIFIDLGGSPTGAVGAGVSIAGNPPMVGWLGLGSSAGPTAADPGDGNGWAAGSIVAHRFGDVPVVLDFEVAIAGFGVTFMHFFHPAFQPFDQPGVLEVFDGPGGSGQRIGTVQSSGGGLEHLDFVGIWSDAINIRSAVISVGSGSFAVDGYGLTRQAVPVPSALLLMGPAFLALAASRRPRPPTLDMLTSDRSSASP